jgi:hypothetical protein
MRSRGIVKRTMLIWPHRVDLKLCPVFHYPAHEHLECIEMVAPGHYIREDDERAQALAEKLYGRFGKKKDVEAP